MRTNIAVLGVAAAALLGSTAALLYSCNRPAESQQAEAQRGIYTAPSPSKAPPLFRAAHDPENPYRDVYRDWDYWVFSKLTDWRAAASTDDTLPDFRFVSVYLDKNGFVLPQLEEERQKRELIKSGSDEPLDVLFQCNKVAAVGVMEPQMWAAMEEAIDRLVEPYFPPIPGWVANALPKKAVLLPDGYVAALDGLGSWDASSISTESDCGCAAEASGSEDPVAASDGSLVKAHAPEHWYLYDPAGRLLEDGHSGWWILMYRSKHGDKLPAGRPRDIGLDGYTEWIDPESGEVLSAWGWDGNPTTPGVNPAPRDRHFFRTISAAQLLRLLQIRKSSNLGGTNE